MHFLYLATFVVGFSWTACVLFFIAHVVFPYIGLRFEEARWMRLHPGMKLERKLS